VKLRANGIFTAAMLLFHITHTHTHTNFIKLHIYRIFIATLRFIALH